MAAANAFRQALKTFSPRLSSLFNATPPTLRPLSSLAATQLDDPPPVSPDTRPSSEAELQKPPPSEEPITQPVEDLTQQSATHSEQQDIGGGRATREQDPSPSGQERRDSEGTEASRSSYASKQPGDRAFVRSPHHSSRARWQDGGPDEVRSQEKHRWAPREPRLLRQEYSVGREKKPIRVRARWQLRSEKDAKFQHALPPEENYEVEGHILEIMHLDPEGVRGYLTGARDVLDPRKMFFIISRVARRMDADRVFQILTWYRDQDFYAADPILYHSIIAPLSPDDSPLGWPIFQLMSADACGTSGTAYTHLLAMCARSNQFWRVFDVMEDMRKHLPGRPDQRDFNNVMGHLLRGRRPIPCEKVFLKMNVAPGNFGVEPDLVSYNTLMSCYAREGHYRKVEALLKEMQRARIEPDSYTCSTVVQAYGKAKLMPRAVRAFEEMRAAGYRPNVIVYNSLLTMLSTSLMPKFATKVVRVVEKYVNMMKNDGFEPDESTQRSLMLSYCKAAMFDKAEAIIDEVSASGKRVPPGLFHGLVHGYAEMGRVNDVVNTIHQFCKAGYQPGYAVRNAMMMAYAKSGDLAKAEEELAHMQKDRVEIGQAACNAMLVAYAAAGHVDKLAPFFKMMEEYNVPASTVTYKLLIAAYGDAGQFDMVDELMAFIREFRHVKLVAFNQLIRTYAQAGRIERMEEAFDVIKYRNMRPGKVIVGEMAAAYTRAGMHEKAAQFNELLTALVEQSESDYVDFIDELDLGMPTEDDEDGEGETVGMGVVSGPEEESKVGEADSNQPGEVAVKQ